jgi:cytochrome b subunit of formate dehydrogenase
MRGIAGGWKRIATLVVAAAALFAGESAFAQSADDCLACHSDDSLTATRDGREISAFVDGAKLAAGAHAGLACVDCHADLAGQGDGHGDEVERVDCATCHDDPVASTARGIHSRTRDDGTTAAACADCHRPHELTRGSEALASCADCHSEVVELQRSSLHGRAAARGDKLAPTCLTCHGSHEILPVHDPKSRVAVMNVPVLCGSCHKAGTEVSQFRDIPQEDILEHYVDSIHGEGLFQKGLTVTAVCTSCHTAHQILPHTDPRSSIAHGNVAATCMQCHAQIEQVHRRVIEGRLWEEAPSRIPICVECHQPHEIRKVFYDSGAANRDCLACHGKPELATVRDGATVSLFVDAEAYATSTHANTACARCHSEVSPAHERPCDTVVSKVDCGVCHAEQKNQYESSIHGRLSATGDPDAPVCLDCHSAHATRGKQDPTSPTFARNVPKLCASCHRAGEKAAVRIESDIPDIVASYADSIHGKGLTESGLVVTATCVNCHTSHGELPPADPESSVHRDNLAATCGTCHHGVEEEFKRSIHATGEAKDGLRLPVCEDCHTSHQIQRADRPGFRTLMMQQCGGCHTEETETFFETFHGKVSRLGTEGAAKCSDCHGSHGILPTTDPASTLSRANIVGTCAQCHPGSNRRFAGYLTHSTHHDKDRWPWLYWSFRFMTLLLVGTLTFALLHTGAWLVRLWLTRDQWRHVKAMREAEGGQKLYRRFTSFQRALHLTMLLSFFTLAITGMVLKFSYATWAQVISRLLGGQPAMAVMHRVAAIVLIIVFVVHVLDVRRKKRESGRTWKEMLTGPDTILFAKRDLTDLVASIRWFFGIGPRPSYGRYTYWEKFDYFAVFWGVMVIGSTGFVLWFPELLTRVLPGWSINVATIVHSDEALLAVGFIFTIHFFNTHFRPDKFPMDPVIFTGRMTLEELKHDKPDEYEQLVREGRLDEHLVDPMPRPVERGFRIFGFAALGVGLVLIVLIVYAMFFGYR